MAVPKRKQSKARRDKRRANYKLVAPAKSVCPECGATKQPHRVCPVCGKYNGRTVLEIETE